MYYLKGHPFGAIRQNWLLTINFILREFVMSKISSDSTMNMDMVVEHLRPQLEVTTKDIEPVIIMGLYHHRDLIGSRDAFMRVI